MKGKDSTRRTLLRSMASIEVLFQLADLEGHRRLRHEQRLRRLGKGEVLCDCVKDLQAAVGHDNARSGE
jgi:hypothetical protein